MKSKKLFFSLALVFSFLCGTVTAQDLYIGASGSLSISSSDALYVNGNLTVDASGNLTINSDATNSASLIVSGTSTGNITYVRYINDTNWHLISAPVIGQSVPVFVADTGNSINTNPTTGNYAVAYYNNANADNSRWVYHNDAPDATNEETLTTFTNGQGYSLNRTAAGNYTFTGSLATDDVAVPLTTASGSHYWSSIGNPFPAFLPANNAAAVTNVFGQNSAALDPSFSGLYFWNGSAYEVINNISGALFIAPGQAFMVRAQDASETFTFTESLLSHQSGATTFYRQENTTPQIIVSLSDSGETKSTQIKYFSNTTVGLDPGYDAGTYQNGTPSFSLDTHLIEDSQGIDFMLQCLPNTDYETMVIPLSVRANANSDISFTAFAENLPDGINVYLEDKTLNIFENISETPYQVTLDDTLAGIGRFYLHTKSSVLSTDDLLNEGAINLYTINNSNLRITGLEGRGNTTLKLYSIAGKEVMSQTFVAQNVNDVPLPKSLRTGIYIASLVSGNSTLNKKIIIE